MRGTISMFGQILQAIPGKAFEKAVAAHSADRNSKGFTCRDQFVSMLFCQLGRAGSLRDISNGVRGCLGKIVHFGMSRAPKKSTLAYANEHRPWEVYRDTFHALLGVCRFAVPSGARKFRFKNKLVSIDSTTISLCREMFDWGLFTRTKGGVKLHVSLDHDGCLPEYAYISNAKASDVKVAANFKFARGTIVCMDRGYNDYRLYGRWHSEGVYFVTKLKDNALYEAVDEYFAPRGTAAVFRIRLKNCDVPMNMVAYVDEKTGEAVRLVTNNLALGATTVVKIYRNRWQIEIFFRYLKSDLKIRTFVGTSENAVRIQIWTALIALLLIKFLQFKSSLHWSFSGLVFMLQHNLFRHKDLWSWINDPYEDPEPELQSSEPFLPGFDFGQLSTS